MFHPNRPCHYLAPAFRPSAGVAQAVIDPATLATVGRIAPTTAEEMAAVLMAVNDAQADWRRRDAKTRAAVLHRLAARIEATDMTACAVLMSREMGKPYPEAIGEIANCAPVFRYYAEMARDEAGKIADLPQGLVACLPGGADLGRALVESDLTHAVAFTGSVAAARAVAAAAGAKMKPAVIEAGGSDPMIICDSAPLDVAAAGAVTAAFHLSGQVCTSAERIYAVDRVHDAFVRAFVAETLRLRIGHGLSRSEIGPLVNKAARDKVMRLVADAVAKGARVECGGRVPEAQTVGWFYAPTILTGCTPDMDILHEECFGPVAAVCRVADFDAAIRAANASAFGLGASVFSTRLDEAMDAAERLEAGMVWINNPMIDNDALPFGGWKASGLGRELGRQGLDAFRRSRMVILDHRPVRQGWWYPYPDDWFLDAGGRKPD